MQQRWFETALGRVPVWGRFEAFRDDKPAVFVIRGAFSELTVLYDVADKLPDVDFAYAHLPGMHSPHIVCPSVERFALALEQAAVAAFPERSVNLLGNSIGALVALRFRWARAIIALEPPLLTAHLWPLRPSLLENARNAPKLGGWIWSVFGVVPDGVTLPRDYRPLISALSAPTCIVLGGDPLEPERPVERMPSLVSAEARIGLDRKVRVLTVGGVGHDIPREAGRVVCNLVRQVCGLEKGEPP